MIVVPVDEQRIDRATIELPRTGEPAEAAAYDDDLGSRRNAHSRSQRGGRSHPSLVTTPRSSMTRGYALASDSRNRATGRCVRAEAASVHSQECPKTGQYPDGGILRIGHLRADAQPVPAPANGTVHRMARKAPAFRNPYVRLP